jgi:hypothetical protein
MNRSGLFWGILLIGAGALALLQQIGYLERMPDQVWTFVFAGVGLIALLNYALSGWKQWAWLFPAGVFGGLAVTIGLSTAGLDDPAVASPLFFGLTIPFLAAFFVDRNRNWWALIPAGVMLFLALTVFIADSPRGELVGALFLFMLGLGFLGAYLNDRSRTWALLVAYVMGVLSLAPLMGANESIGPAYGAVFLFAIAVPFFVVYLRTPERWWALIPGTVMTVLAVITLLAIAGLIENECGAGLVTALLMGGIAAAFAVIWLRHGKPWAKVVTIILAALALASALFAAQSEILWPVALIVVGLYLLYVSRRKTTA